jgi:carotenoid 1,2-hydratase
VAATPVWRVGRSVRSDEGLMAVKTLEDTPFYARSQLRRESGGHAELAMHESLDLDRFSRRWVRTLLPFRMPRRAGW